MWNSGPAKQAILSFVKGTTEQSSPKYVKPSDRVATFDQDGTLWTEQPVYAQGMFALDRVGKLAPKHPEWKEKMPFKAIIEHDQEAMSKFTESDWMEIIAVTHAGMSTEAFLALVKQWLATAKAPRFDRPYTDSLVEYRALSAVDSTPARTWTGRPTVWRTGFECFGGGWTAGIANEQSWNVL